MVRKCRIVGLGLGILAVGVASGLVAQQPATTNTANVADTLVNQCANIRFGELVLIKGGTRDQQMLEDIAVEVRKLGAHPLITIGSDSLTHKMLTEVPAKFDTQDPSFALKMAETVDAVISVDFTERLDLLADVSAERLTNQNKTFEPVYKKMLERGVLQVHLGNGLYPTTARAKQFGITKSELSRIFWNGVNTDYDRLQSTGARVKNILASGQTVRIIAPNGTDLTVEITQRPVFISDGVISSEDRYAGGPACQVWLPAGEVYVTPVPKTARGTFVADNFFFEGKHIKGLKLMFRDGKLTSMTSKSDITALQERYQAAPEGRDVFAAIDIGINPSVQTPSGSRMVTWMAAGTISIGIGNNTWAGGDNDVPFDLFAHLTNGKLTVDRKTIVDRGKLLDR
ncbi:MAG: aminopeptidase [Planctomycetes bacterium]|nr:aminopeptidase [Planctomycetota bacterium]